MLDDAELNEILADIGRVAPASAYESSFLDFKEPTNNIKKSLGDLADAAVCFANADGGTIVLG